MGTTPSNIPTGSLGTHPDMSRYESDNCGARSFHRLVSTDDGRSESSGLSRTMTAHHETWSSFDSHLQKHASQMFDQSIMERFVARQKLKNKR